MITFTNSLQVNSIQASLFISNLVFSTSKILKTVLEACSNQFDGDPTVLPLLDDAPREIPRIVLENKNKSMKLEVAPIRLNLFRLRAPNEKDISANEFLKTAAEILNVLIEEIGADCTRMAVVLERFWSKKNPAREIAQHFCKKRFIERPFDDPSAFELHSLKKFRFLNMLDLNSWVRIKSGSVRTGTCQQLLDTHC